jgi:DNA-binding transcriptional regulator YbjK
VSRAPSGDHGEQRRQELLEATLTVLAENGTRGVTHRAVSQAAGASLGLTRYWFASREQLLEAALRYLVERDVSAITTAIETVVAEAPREEIPSRVAVVFAAELALHRVRALARYELFLEAARRPPLRDALREWREAYCELIAQLLRASGNDHDGVRPTLVLDAVNGLLLDQLAAPRPDFLRAVLEPAMAQLLGSKTSTPCVRTRVGALTPASSR